ncbi:MAG: ParA family protein [Clostridia bacterium]|jgi:cellulose biosynthesis protein BcsQ|nr:ParA family protein [Clostridia bacterium]MDH7573851.1 ParA family protein [Clostridia bacterium]
MAIVTVFNHKGGVGKTTVAFNLGLMLGELQNKVLLVDLDPQANLTALALDEQRFESLYTRDEAWTIAAAFRPLVSGSGDYEAREPVKIRDNVYLIPGDIRLAEFESLLPVSWTESLAGQERGFRITSAIYRLLKEASSSKECRYTICDVGPNIGALNRAIITSTDYLIVPVSSDLFSLRAIDTVGQSIVLWHNEWLRARQGVPRSLPFEIPHGSPRFLGYIIQQFGIYGGRPASAYRHWHDRLEPAIQEGITAPLGAVGLVEVGDATDLKLADIQNFHSLAPNAQRNHKAIFELDATEALGQHQYTVSKAREIYQHLATKVMSRTQAGP